MNFLASKLLWKLICMGYIQAEVKGIISLNIKSQDRVWQHEFLSQNQYWDVLLNTSYSQFFQMSAQIRRWEQIFKTNWREILKESRAKQESKNETVCFHKHWACTLLCLAQEVAAAACAHTKHNDQVTTAMQRAHLSPTHHPCIPPLFPVSIWALVQLRAEQLQHSSSQDGEKVWWIA